MNNKHTHLGSNNEDLEKFIAFRDANWTGGPTMLQLIISTHLYIENGLDEMLKKVLVYDDAVAKLPFKAKLIIASSLGIDGEDVELFKLINILRNKFAHKLNYQLTWGDVQKISKYSTITKKDWDNHKDNTLNLILSGVLGHSSVVFEYGSKMKISK